MKTNATEETVLRAAYAEPMECPRCGEVTLYQLAHLTDNAGRPFVELECTHCGHYETGSVA